MNVHDNVKVDTFNQLTKELCVLNSYLNNIYYDEDKNVWVAVSDWLELQEFDTFKEMFEALTTIDNIDKYSTHKKNVCPICGGCGTYIVGGSFGGDPTISTCPCRL